MKRNASILGVVAAVCVSGLAAPAWAAAAEVSEADLKSLREALQKLNEKVQKLEDAHQKDQQELQQLRNRVGGTLVAPVATQPAMPAFPTAAVQPVHPIPTDERNVNRNFMVLGDAEIKYEKASHQNGAFQMADFAPIFLYRAGDNVLFEAGFDFVIQNNAPAAGGYTTTVNLSFAQLDYLINDYATLVAGNMVLPLGTYSERTAGWLNKFPDDPLARGFLPGAGVGVQLRGAVPVGDSGQSIAYSVYGVNGPSSIDGTGAAGKLDLGGNVGFRSDNAVANLHGHPSGGGRVGWFVPFQPHYDLELGLSGQTGEWDTLRTHLWSAGALDATIHLGSSLELRGEYIRSWYGTDDLGNVRPVGWWTQAGYKLAGLNLDLPVIKNTELVARYDSAHDGQGIRTRRTSVGYIYYITNALLFEGDYEFIRSNQPGGQGNTLIFQLGYGF